MDKIKKEIFMCWCENAVEDDKEYQSNGVIYSFCSLCGGTISVRQVKGKI